ncbi:MAG: ABC transporter permease [Anaerolineae bacterium]
MTTTTKLDSLGDSSKKASIITLSSKAERGVSNWQRSFRRLRQHRMAIFGFALLAAIIGFVVIGSLLIPESVANYNDASRKLQPPSAEHWFGTDQIGRDLFARSIWGGQMSLFIGVTAVLLQMVVGTAIGLIAGYVGGVLDALLMRIAEAMLSIPQLFLALIAVRIFAGTIPDFRFLGREFSSTFVVMILIIGLTSWMRVARIVRAAVLSLKEQEFVTAARSLGTPTRRLLMQHILPNCFAPVIVSATLGVGGAILLEAYLGFLGLGVRAPTATWGNIIGDSYRFLSSWYFWFFPALFIILTGLAINFIGDGLRDAFDPKSLK